MIALIPDDIIFTIRSMYPYASHLAAIEAIFETKA
jgi:hypothetical protein